MVNRTNTEVSAVFLASGRSQFRYWALPISSTKTGTIFPSENENIFSLNVGKNLYYPPIWNDYLRWIATFRLSGGERFAFRLLWVQAG